MIKPPAKVRKKRTNKQPHSVDAAYIVGYFGIPAMMTSYTRMDVKNTQRVMVYFKPTPEEGCGLKSGIEYHTMQCCIRFNKERKRNERVENIESEIALLVAYLADPPKCRQWRMPIAKRLTPPNPNLKITI